MTKKILLFGPIGDYGGRELESGFIASVLSAKYEVAICSTGVISKGSQVFDFHKKVEAFSVKSLMFDRFWLIKLLAYFSFLKNFCKGKTISYVNNSIAKRFFSYDKKLKIVLDELITNYDVVFICAQLSSVLVNEVIQIAKEKKRKIEKYCLELQAQLLFLIMILLIWLIVLYIIHIVTRLRLKIVSVIIIQL